MSALISTRIDGCVGSGPLLNSGLAVFRFRDGIDEALGAATQDRLADGHGPLCGNRCLGFPGGMALVALGLGCFFFGTAMNA